ncbi:NAD(P)-binding protein [Astrocystis sublimbata]|nr:NAD(P)-binding protein [Astrocystis sublimbata]
MAPKIVLITGCSAGGIGAALATTLATHGHFVIATARNTSKVPAELSSRPNVQVIPLDVSSTSSVADAAKAVIGGQRGLDVLVNNAGSGYAMPILDIDVEKAKEVYETNVWGPIRTVQGFSDLLIKSRGRVVNISTVGSVLPLPWISTYSASKAAMTLQSEALRFELEPFGVSVVTIMAGIIDSNFHANDPGARIKLPARSHYSSISDVIAGWATGRSKPPGITADAFSEQILDDVVGLGKGSVMWRGPNAGSVKIAKWLMPASMLDNAMRKGQGLEDLKRKELVKGDRN